jgi:hypothetical protein
MNQQKISVKTHGEKRNLQNGLNKVEGILTSSIKLKEPRNDSPYY